MISSKQLAALYKDVPVESVELFNTSHVKGLDRVHRHIVTAIELAPPPGWLQFGSHFGEEHGEVRLEFWGEEFSLDGMPLWERPVADEFWEFTIAGHDQAGPFETLERAVRYNDNLANIDIDPGTVYTRRRAVEEEWKPVLCICDGARMVDRIQKHPFLTNDDCPYHGSKK